MFTVIIEYHNRLRKAGLMAAPDKTFFFLKKIEFLGHVISPEGIHPFAERVKDLKNLNSAESKRDFMKVFGSSGFYRCYIQKLHVGQPNFLRLDQGFDPCPLDKQTRKTLPINDTHNQ